MLGIALALLSAATSGFSVVIVGKHNRKSSALSISLIVTAIGLAVLCPLAILANEFSVVNWEGVVLFALGGMLTPGLVRLFYYSGLKMLGTAVNSSIFAVYPLYSSLLAMFFLDESLAFGNWIGVFAIVIGIVFVEMTSCGINGGNSRSTRNLVFPIVGGLTLGASAIIRKYALNLCNAPVLGVAIAYVFSFVPFAIMLTIHKTDREELSLKQDLRLFWIAGVGQAISWILSFYALSLERVAIVAPMLSIEPIFVVLLAYLYLRELERVCAKLVASIALTVLGVILVLI